MQGLNLSQPGLKHDPNWFRTAVFYEVLVRGVRRLQGLRRRRLHRPDRPARLPAVARRRLPLAAAVLRLAAARRRLRHRRLHRGAARVRHAAGVHRAGLAGARPRHPHRHRPRHEPHQRPAPVVPGRRAPTPRARTATSTCGPTPTTKYADARIIFVDTEVSNWTFDPVRRQFFWHRFFSHQPDLNFENPAVHEAMFDVVRFWMDLGHRRLPARRDPLPLRARRAPTARTCPKTHEFLAKLRAMVDEEYPGPDHARRGQPVARGRRGLLRHRGGAGVPHVLPLPRHAAALLLAARGEGRADRRRPGRHPGHPAAARSGARSCATTTS